MVSMPSRSSASPNAGSLTIRFYALDAALRKALKLSERWQHRFERRHLGGEQSVDTEHAGESRRNRAARHSRQPNLWHPIIAQFWNPLTAAGRAALDAMITRQAQIIAYIDDYKLLMIATLAVIPLLIVFKQASDGGGEDHTLVVE
jgi:hypothetical protein